LALLDLFVYSARHGIRIHAHDGDVGPAARPMVRARLQIGEADLVDLAEVDARHEVAARYAELGVELDPLHFVDAELCEQEVAGLPEVVIADVGLAVGELDEGMDPVEPRGLALHHDACSTR